VKGEKDVQKKGPKRVNGDSAERRRGEFWEKSARCLRKSFLLPRRDKVGGSRRPLSRGKKGNLVGEILH